MQDLINTLESNNSLVLVIPADNYLPTILDIVKYISSSDKKIGYISMNRIISQVRKSLLDKNINIDKIFFLDAITKSVIATPESYKNCVYLSSPKDLTKLSIAMTKMMKNFEPDYVIFDSVSTLLIYERVSICGEFLHSNVNKISAYGAKSIFACMPGDKEEDIIKTLSLAVNKIVRL